MKYGFSSAYWHLTSSIYNESVGEYPYLPDALLTYGIPAKAAEIQFLSKEVVYDINDPKGKVWALLQNQGGNAKLDKGEGSLTIEITDGGNVTYSVMTLLSGFTIEKMQLMRFPLLLRQRVITAIFIRVTSDLMMSLILNMEVFILPRD